MRRQVDKCQCKTRRAVSGSNIGASVRRPRTRIENGIEGKCHRRCRGLAAGLQSTLKEPPERAIATRLLQGRATPALIGLGALMLSRLTRTIEARLVDVLPEWLTKLTTRF